MKLKISSKRSLLASGVGGILLFLAIILFLIFRQSIRASYAKQVLPVQSVASSTQAEQGLPIRLKIPKISVDASVEYAGLAPDGSVGVPKGPEGVAWFDLGPRPGEIGSAVISGHYGWKNNIPAVFDNLYQLNKGDRIYVEDGEGTTTTFLVSGFRAYGEKDSAPDVFDSSDGKAHLNLVTCMGVWNKAEKSYSKRLVVFADKE